MPTCNPGPNPKACMPGQRSSANFAHGSTPGLSPTGRTSSPTWRTSAKLTSRPRSTEGKSRPTASNTRGDGEAVTWSGDVPEGDGDGTGAGDDGSPGGEHQAALPGRQQPYARLAGLGEPVGGHAGQVGRPGPQRGDAGEERLGDVQVQQQPGDGDDLAAEQRAEPGPGHPEQGGRDDHGAQDAEVPVAGQGDRDSPGRQPRQRDRDTDRDAGQRVAGAGQQVGDQLGGDDPGAARGGQEGRGGGAVPELARHPGRAEDGSQRPGAAGADREQRVLPGSAGQRWRQAARPVVQRDR